jgi:hypothetical protein
VVISRENAKGTKAFAKSRRFGVSGRCSARYARQLEQSNAPTGNAEREALSPFSCFRVKNIRGGDL